MHISRKACLLLSQASGEGDAVEHHGGSKGKGRLMAGKGAEGVGERLKWT